MQEEKENKVDNIKRKRKRTEEKRDKRKIKQKLRTKKLTIMPKVPI